MFLDFFLSHQYGSWKIVLSIQIYFNSQEFVIFIILRDSHLVPFQFKNKSDYKSVKWNVIIWNNQNFKCKSLGLFISSIYHHNAKFRELRWMGWSVSIQGNLEAGQFDKSLYSRANFRNIYCKQENKHCQALESSFLRLFRLFKKDRFSVLYSTLCSKHSWKYKHWGII